MKLLTPLLILLLLAGYFYFRPSPAEISMMFGSDSGALSPGTMADDATVGTLTWNSVDEANFSENVYATAGVLVCGTQPVYDNAVRIVKGGTIGSTDKSNANAWPEGDTYRTYGSSSDLWGETWTADDINASTFGFVLSAKGTFGEAGYAVSHYLKATNFGFSIPAGAIIDGIVVEVEQQREGNGDACP